MTITMLQHFLFILVAMATLYPVGGRLVDLSHDHSKDTIMSTPTMPRYNTTLLFDGDLLPGVYAMWSRYSIAEHGGTHVDAPRHFSKDGMSLDQIPLENTIGDGVMIDCTNEVANNPDYALTLQKVREWEEENGEVPREAAVVINFNWSQYFNDSNLYFNTNDTSNSSSYRYPVISDQAIDYLVDDRDIKLIAMDVMGPDLMVSTFYVHKKLLSNNKMIVENLKDPGRLPTKGFRFHASPVKFVGGTGVQVRAYAMIVDGDEGGTASRQVGGSFTVLVFFALIVALL